MIRRSDRAQELKLLARATQCGNPTFIKAVLLNNSSEDAIEDLTLRFLGADKARRDMLLGFAKTGTSEAVIFVVNALADRVLQIRAAAKDVESRVLDKSRESGILRTEASKLENFCMLLATTHDEARRPNLAKTQELPIIDIEQADAA